MHRRWWWWIEEECISRHLMEYYNSFQFNSSDEISTMRKLVFLLLCNGAAASVVVPSSVVRRVGEWKTPEWNEMSVAVGSTVRKCTFSDCTLSRAGKQLHFIIIIFIQSDSAISSMHIIWRRKPPPLWVVHWLIIPFMHQIMCLSIIIIIIHQSPNYRTFHVQSASGWSHQFTRNVNSSLLFGKPS